MQNFDFDNVQNYVLTASDLTFHGGGGLQRNRLSKRVLEGFPLGNLSQNFADKFGNFSLINSNSSKKSAPDSSKIYRTWGPSAGFCLDGIDKSERCVGELFCAHWGGIIYFWPAGALSSCFCFGTGRAADFLADGALGSSFCLDGEVGANFLTLAALNPSFCLGQNNENFRLAELRT